MTFRHLSLSHTSLLNHGDEPHFENRERLESILQAFKKNELQHLLNLSCQRRVTLEEILLVHKKEYLDRILALDGKYGKIDEETFVSPGSVEAAFKAVGLGIELLEKILNQEIDNGFALVRPPGHHARPSTGMGFCIFNNISITAKKALSLGVNKILILDWDVHHGNGTQEAFYEDDRVLHIDLHQANLFPSTTGNIDEIGKGKGKGFTVNVPLPPKCNDNDYLYVFDKVVKPIAREYQPELILVSAGFDAHESDQLGFMCLTSLGFRELTREIKALAEELCQGKLLFFLEGGYNPYWLAANVIECVQILSQKNPLPYNREKSPPSQAVKNVVDELFNLRS